MKSTEERLSEVYCRPKTKDEWTQVAFVKKLGRRFCHQQDAVSFWIDGDKGVVSDAVPFDRTEIPFSHFIDLLNDRIVPWRLKEDGFEDRSGCGYVLELNVSEALSIVVSGDVSIYANGERIRTNITTYTDLITLIRLIG